MWTIITKIWKRKFWTEISSSPRNLSGIRTQCSVVINPRNGYTLERSQWRCKYTLIQIYFEIFGVIKKGI